MNGFVECSLEQQGAAILEIFNDAIAHTTALYDYQERTLDDMRSWFAAKHEGNLPVVGLESSDKKLMGFATYGRFRPQAAYLHTVEHSVYVHSDYRGNGLGRTLLVELIQRAKEQGHHQMLGLIDAQNEASIHLHQSIGFQHAGTLKEVGYKFERWLDVEIYQLPLASH
ncbi:GNAT family N-acetyltransferase [Pelagicoccus mobilis]|uniref:N-acetyltransferase n=1 Tax=Pelagicoccus mobilis TaxID=415221 RepID=A0A934S2N6_9BACT|nr:GNAT family N-acetyltransferase [Pelagicoccus mobilis]MBK1878319.1 N-acetyltransferase [Pelagicoccus mobilis]